MRDPSGVSRGSGFVAFSSPEEASRAVSDYNIKKTCQIVLSAILCFCGRISMLNTALYSLVQITEMNGKMIVTKPLYVALAQRKEDRKARLQVWLA